MKRVSIFDEIERIPIQAFKTMRRELGKNDSFFVLTSAPHNVSSDDRKTLIRIMKDYGVCDDAFQEDDALENAAWAVMSRSTFLK